MKEISKKECHLYQFRGGQEIFMFFCDKEGIFIKNVSFYTKENSLTH